MAPNEVARQLNGVDILVHASRWEGLPRTVVQALLTEVPVISYDNDGAPEVVVNDQTGVLLPCGDSDGLSKAILRLAQDPLLCRRMGQLGRKRCEVMFDWQSMVEKLSYLYGPHERTK
jgi:glycosyltransferase involved in cell wall biosynthesis